MRILEQEELPQHDAHVVLANKTFRDCGFTIKAMSFKRSPAALAALREYNKVPEAWKHPFAWGYHPNASLKEKFERTGRL